MPETCKHNNARRTLIATDRILIQIKFESGHLDSKCSQRKKILISHSLYNITPFVIVHLLATKSDSNLRRWKKSTENSSKRVALFTISSFFPRSSVLDRDFIFCKDFTSLSPSGSSIGVVKSCDFLSKEIHLCFLTVWLSDCSGELFVIRKICVFEGSVFDFMM